MNPRLALATGAALSALACAVPARAALFETEPRTYSVTSHHHIRMEFPVGELKVVATDETRVRFDLRVRCNRSDDQCQ